MWECPNFFPLGDRHVLLISPIPLRKVLYLVGEYRDHRFTPERTGIVDDGGCYYAPQAMLDERGRRLLWGWLYRAVRNPMYIAVIATIVGRASDPGSHRTKRRTSGLTSARRPAPPSPSCTSTA